MRVNGRNRNFIRNRAKILANLPGTVTEIQEKLENSLTDACIRKHLQGMLRESQVSREEVRTGPKRRLTWRYLPARAPQDSPQLSDARH